MRSRSHRGTGTSSTTSTANGGAPTRWTTGPTTASFTSRRTAPRKAASTAPTDETPSRRPSTPTTGRQSACSRPRSTTSTWTTPSSRRTSTRRPPGSALSTRTRRPSIAAPSSTAGRTCWRTTPRSPAPRLDRRAQRRPQVDRQDARRPRRHAPVRGIRDRHPVPPARVRPTEPAGGSGGRRERQFHGRSDRPYRRGDHRRTGGRAGLARRRRRRGRPDGRVNAEGHSGPNYASERLDRGVTLD